MIFKFKYEIFKINIRKNRIKNNCKKILTYLRWFIL
jgi:hypothetical protein